MSNRYLRGEIWYCNLEGYPNSSVQKGKRPVLIISNNTGNDFGETVIIAPITTKLKPLPTHLGVDLGDRPSEILFEQITTVPKNRLYSYVKTIDSSLMSLVEKKIMVSLGIIGYSVEAAKSNLDLQESVNNDLKCLEKKLPVARELAKQLLDICRKYEGVSLETGNFDKFKKVSQKRTIRTWDEKMEIYNRYKNGESSKNLIVEYGFSNIGNFYQTVHWIKKKLEISDKG